MNKIIAVVLALALTATPSFAATYTLKIANEDQLRPDINRVWVKGGTVEGKPCGWATLCVKTITLPDGVCSAVVTLKVGRGRADTNVNWCASGGVVELELH